MADRPAVELRRTLSAEGGVQRMASTRNVAALGVVSLCMGVSSFMVLGLLPAFVVNGLGASALWVGAIEGTAESTASLVKVLSGVLSDRLGRRKPLLLCGYVLAAAMKTLFPLARLPIEVLAIRVFDRVGKGLRDAPRDALIADLTAVGTRGWHFGLRFALFSIGAMVGPLAAMLLMAATGDNYRVVFAAAVIPAMMSVVALAIGVHEPRKSARRRLQLRRLHDLRQLPAAVWWPIGFAALLAAGRVGQAFLLLAMLRVGVDPAYVPLTLVLIYGLYSVSAYPLGAMADRFDRRRMLAYGAGLLVAGDVVLAAANSVPAVVAGTVLWGLQMGAVHGALGASIAAATPQKLRGLAFGAADLAVGVAALCVSFAAGALWVGGGPVWVFGTGAILAAGAFAVAATWLFCTKVGDKRR